MLALPDEAVLRVLAAAMAETLAAGSVLAEATCVTLAPDVTRWWEADDLFLDLVRDRGVVNAMVGEVAGQAVADANLSEKAKVQKAIIRDSLKGEGRARQEGWIPRYMAFPADHYDPQKTLQIAADWAAVKHLFTA